MNYKKITILLSALLAVSFCSSQKLMSVEKPMLFQFGRSMASMKDQLATQCDSLAERRNEPIQLATAKKEQSQLEVYGFTFAGKKRKAELIFADDALDIVWILTEAEEESYFIDRFKEKFGEPTHTMEEATFFLNDGVAVRNQPHEVLFISERLKAPYQQWLDSQNE